MFLGEYSISDAGDMIPVIVCFVNHVFIAAVSGYFFHSRVICPVVLTSSDGRVGVDIFVNLLFVSDCSDSVFLLERLPSLPT